VAKKIFVCSDVGAVLLFQSVESERLGSVQLRCSFRGAYHAIVCIWCGKVGVIEMFALQ
jgi:hypothetical protein